MGGIASCQWCGGEARESDCYELVLAELVSGISFCRLEHIVPWVLDGATRGITEKMRKQHDAGDAGTVNPCICCGNASGDSLELIRRRAGVVYSEYFCGLGHLREWASAGGLWARSV